LAPRHGFVVCSVYWVVDRVFGCASCSLTRLVSGMGVPVTAIAALSRVGVVEAFIAMSIRILKPPEEIIGRIC